MDAVPTLGLAAADADPELGAAVALLSGAPREHLLGELCRVVRDLVGADRSAVVQAAGEELVVLATSLLKPRQQGLRGTGVRVPSGGTLAALTLATGRAQLCPDVDGHVIDGEVVVMPDGIRANVTLPLSDGLRVVAALSVMAVEPYALDERSVARAEALLAPLADELSAVLAAVAALDASAALGEAEQSRRLAAALSLAGLATWETRLGTDEWSWSPEMYALAGLEPGTPVTDEMVRGFFTAGSWGDLTDSWQRVLADREPRQVTAEVSLPDGRVRTVEVWLDLSCDEDGRPVRQWGVVQDVSERISALRTLQENEELFRLTFDHAPIGMLMLDVSEEGRGRALRSNRAFRQMLGRYAVDSGEDPMHAATIHDWSRPEDVATDLMRLDRFVRGVVESETYEKTYVRSDGSTFDALVTSAMARDRHGRPLHIVSHVLDVSERAAQGRELQRMALTDGLTGLANRRLMEDALSQSLARLTRRDGVVGLVLLDLDHFKVVNDSLGHGTGDHLLVEVASRLRAHVRADTTVARLGGDEFVAVVGHAQDLAEVEAIGRRLLTALREPFAVGGRRIVATASLGVAVSGRGGTPAELLREADLALYRAKETGRDRVVRFDTELRTKADARLATEGMLREALDAGWLRLFTQPVVSLVSGDQVGAEALVRIQHPELGLVLPGDFIRVAEECGLVTDVDAWVLDAAVARLARHGAARLAVNVSARSIETGEIPARVEEALARYGVAGHRLDVELTESSLLSGGEGVSEDLSRIRRLGCRVGLDDFGTGYSALSYLQALELDFLKIDRSFIARLGQGVSHDAVVKAVIDLAHAHRLTVVAEGIEEAAQTHVLSAMGCDRGQGWFFGRPRPAGR